MSVQLRNEVFDWLVNLLNNNLDEINSKLSEWTSTPVSKVWRGSQIAISTYPAIRVEPGPITSEWGATRSRNDRYSFTVTVLVKSVKVEKSLECTNHLTQIIREILLAPNNLSFPLEGGGSVYNAYCDTATPVVSEEGALRSAGLNIWYDVWVTDILTGV